VLQRTVEGVELFGAITLNPAVGGINPSAVEVSARLGARVVWMPTLYARSERRQDGIAILDDGGALLPAVRDVLALVRQYNLVLGTGHLLEPELRAVVSEARRMGIERIVITHASKIAGTSLDLALQRELADQGAVIEHSFGHTFPQFGNVPLAAMLEAIRAVGPERCLVSTDLGRADCPSPWEGMRQAIAALGEAGVTEREVCVLVQDNPRRLLQT
jgi:sugar phosphate isomerase/epimerase